MKRLISLSITMFFVIQTLVAKDKHKHRTFVEISTDYGSCIAMLYDETPQHKDNFIKLTKEGFFNKTLFHRVIKDFMIQGGDPQSKEATPDQMLGAGDLGYRIPAEIVDTIIHKRGALAAARDNNPEKSSSSCQFYIVQGQKFSDFELNEITKKMDISFSQKQRESYQNIGGAPFLDKNYTVFGQVVEGMEMIDRITRVDVNVYDRPNKDIPMNVRLLSKREIKDLKVRLGWEKSPFFRRIFFFLGL